MQIKIFLKCNIMDCIKVLAFLAFIIGSCTAITLTKWTNCGSHGIIHSIELTPCDHENCVIHKGQTYHTSINFTAQESSTTLTNVCHGIIADQEMPFQVSPKDACGNGVTCPLIPGENKIYTASVTCPSDVLSMRLSGKWEVKDENDRDLICFVFPLKIVD